MASEIEICNLALDLAGTRTIVSLGDGSPEAQACQRLYPQALLATLESSDWRFARARQALNRLAHAPASKEWRYTYQRPAKCLRARYIEPVSLRGHSVLDQDRYSLQPTRQTLHAPRFQVEGDTILTDLEEAVLVFTQRIDEAGLLPALFVAAMAAYLGYRLATSLRADPDLALVLMRSHQDALQHAAAADLNEAHDPEDRQAEWVEARL
ncbi:MAG: phage protein [Rhodospirillales bacterium]